MYFNNCIANVYIMPDEDEKNFSAAFLIKKEMDHEKHIEALSWDSVHIVHVGHLADKLELKLTSTVFITLGMNWKDMGNMSLCGSCAHSKNKNVPYGTSFKQNPNGFYMAEIGLIIEENEDNLRAKVADSYITKQR